MPQDVQAKTNIDQFLKSTQDAGLDIEAATSYIRSHPEEFDFTPTQTPAATKAPWEGGMDVMQTMRAITEEKKQNKIKEFRLAGENARRVSEIHDQYNSIKSGTAKDYVKNFFKDRTIEEAWLI